MYCSLLYRHLAYCHAAPHRRSLQDFSLFCFAECWWSWALTALLDKSSCRAAGSCRDFVTSLLLGLSAYTTETCCSVSVGQRSWSPLPVSGGDSSPDSLRQGPSWAAAAASCLLTPLPPLLPVLGQTRLKPPLPYPTPHLCWPLKLTHSSGFSCWPRFHTEF